MSGRRNGLTAAALALAAGAVLTVSRTAQVRRRHPPLGRLMEVDGLRLHVVEQGKGPPLVLLHGNGSMAEDFLSSGLVALAAKSHRVLVFDRPGYGWSERPRRRRMTAAAQADLLAAALRQIGAGPVHLLGHSWGTIVALAFAERHPDRLSALTLVSGYYYPTLRPDAWLAAGPAVPVLGDIARYAVTPFLLRLLWPLTMRRVFGPNEVPERFREAVPRAIVLAPQALRASALESAEMVDAAAALRGFYPALAQRVAEGFPVTILAGEADRLVDPAAQSVRLATELGTDRLRLFPGVGHMLHQIEPRGVMEAIRAAETA